MNNKCIYGPFAGMVLAVFLLLFAVEASSQQIRVQGRITNKMGKAIQDVDVLDPFTKKQLDTSDEDGRYSVLVDKTDSLKFTCMSYKPKTVKVKGKQIIDVVLDDNAFELAEVTIVSKVRKKVVPEPTDIEIKGNYFYLKTRIPVSKEMFSKNRRLVVQPSIYDITDSKRMLLRPLVFDGGVYNITQQRMYDYDMKNDPLEDYIVLKTTSSRQDDLLTYYDSVYVDNQQHDFRADVHLAMENYREVFYRDSFSIARGTVNPLRFLEYNLSAFELTDEKFLPKPVMQLRDTKGEVNLTFLVGKADLDEKNQQNIIELTRLRSELSAIEGNPDASLKNFYITGVSSPDGSYALNLDLAQKRTDKALEQILNELSSDTRRYLEVKSDAEVASWDDVLKLVQKDTLNAVADEMKQLMEHYSGDRLGRMLKTKPFYTTLKDSYLPLLRRVRYTYGYSVFRILTDEEIKTLYAQNPKELTRYEYYRLIDKASSETDKEKYCREALALYDNFLYAANTLAVIQIKKGKYDSSILEKYVGKNAPAEVLSNQAIALLEEGKYNKADSVLLMLPENEKYKSLRAVVQAKAGYYEEAFEEVAAISPLNEVVMLLAMKENQRAWDRLSRMQVTTAREYYVKAIAANRLENLVDAIISIELALQMDPSLLEIARVDSDVLDLLPQEQKINMNTTNQNGDE